MSEIQPQVKYLKDYQPPAYSIITVDLTFDLFEDHALVKNLLFVEKNLDLETINPPLELDGRDLELISVSLNQEVLNPDQFEVNEESLILEDPPDQFQLEIWTRLEPQKNTSLEGLYKSSKMFCTQCEAEGFRKITYYPDRPDVMARFSTKIIADQTLYPVLLSNGNPVEQGTLENNRHWVRWKDPHKKPSYLFALVAGDLEALEDQFTTRSGRTVTLKIFVEKENIDKCDHAMKSLKQCMKWDEEVYGREYDLDIFMIVAVADFNMGAMENKGLNIFNSSYVLARPETATDMNFDRIQGVIAHEYFHNWTGNRITCRDWFQLSLKEGLTIFRDQQFSSDMTSKTVKRVQDVNVLRAAQFVEDSGPMAHSVRPDSYIEINNFYTATIYYKGAELIRMMYTLLGKSAYYRGMDLYFERHDGQAVTTEDFVKCMEDVSGVDLSQFRLWYTQAGTPIVTAKTDYDPEKKELSLSFAQQCPPTPGQPDKKPFHIPVKTGLIDANGKELRPTAINGEKVDHHESLVLNLTDETQVFRFSGVDTRPVLSLLREFSAPVKLDFTQAESDQIFLIANDTDDFNRWQASQQLLIQKILGLIQIQRKNKLTTEALWATTSQEFDRLVSAFMKTLKMPDIDKLFAAQLISLPGEPVIADKMDIIDVDSLHHVRNTVKIAIATQMKEILLDTYHSNIDNGPYSADSKAVGQRAIRNLCLNYLMSLDDAEVFSLCVNQFESADNMTDEIEAFQCLVNKNNPQRQSFIDSFFEKWKRDPLVMDMWFTAQSASPLTSLDAVEGLMKNSAFDSRNPNKLRSVIGTFCGANLVNFHTSEGTGYSFLASQVEALNKQNPQIAARLLTPLTRWKKFDKDRQELMKKQLEYLAGLPGLSPDVFEIVTKSLK